MAQNQRRPGLSEAEREIIRKMYPRAPWAEIYKALGHRSPKSIQRWASKMGVKREVRDLGSHSMGSGPDQLKSLGKKGGILRKCLRCRGPFYSPSKVIFMCVRCKSDDVARASMV